MEIKVTVNKKGKFFIAKSSAYPVFTQGHSRSEAIENFKEAFLLYAQDVDAQVRFPELAQLFPATRFDIKLILPLQKLLTYAPTSNFIRTTVSPSYV